MKFKKLVAVILSIVLLFCEIPFSTIIASAATYTEGDYKYTVSNGEATINNVYYSISGDVIIPETLGGYPVVSMGAAFNSCRRITSIIIPKNVRSISNAGFNGCDNLKSITVDSSNQYYSSEDGVLYNKDKTELIRYPIGKTATEFTIPNSVKSIAEYAFSYCSSYGFKNITIPNSVTNIGDYAFRESSLLTSIIIPDSVTSMGYMAFYDCDNLRSVKVGSGITVDSDPTSNTTDVYASAFFDCDNLTSITVDSNNEYYSSIDGVLYNKDITKLIRYPHGKTSTEFLLPDSVISIGHSAFSYCNNLASITLSDNVTNICDGAFFNCDSLTSITIPNSLTKIGGSAFYDCDSLTSITIPNSVTNIYGNTFYSCDSLTSVTLSDSVKTIYFEAFFDCYRLTSITIPASVTSVGYSAFEYCNNLLEVTIKSRDCEIDSDAFPETTVIRGYKGSTAEKYAIENGNIFCDLITSNTYYGHIGDRVFNICDDQGIFLKGCIIDVNGVKHTVDSIPFRVAIPSDFNGDITISHPGYITVTRSVEDLKDFNFITLYPNSVTNPIVQQMNLYDKDYPYLYDDLLREYEYIYDLSGKQYDLYLDIYNNGNTISSIYLLQGDKKINLQNGMNENVAINSTFNSDGGTIYLCVSTNDGIIYKMNSHIVAKKAKVTFCMDDMGSMSGEIDESLDAVGGVKLSANLKIGKLPVNIEVGDGGTFKGTIGVQADDSFTATYYEKIKNTIIKNTSNGKDEFPSLEMAKLDKYLSNEGGEVIENSSNFGIGATVKIVGYVEGSINPYTGEIENLETKCVMSVSGKLSYTQQSIAYVLPYYWKVEFETNLSVLFKSVWKSEDKKVDEIPFKMPAITISIGVGGELCAGINQVAGGGVRLTGKVTGTLSEPDYDFESSVWKVSLDFEVIGQIAGFEAGFTPFGEHLVDYQIYPEAKNLKTMSLNDNVTYNARMLSRGYLNESSTFNANLKTGNQNIIKSNTYTYTAPQAVQLANGNILLVWLDDDTDRTDINRTALYYSIYNSDTKKWSTPLQVEDDGTADFSPKLKILDGTPYLLWTDCGTALSQNADINTVLADMDISYAKFNGESFAEITRICDNNIMDTLPDIALVNNIPTVVWISNNMNDVLFSNGSTKIMKAEKMENVWSISTVVSDSTGINSFAVCEENDQLAIYYSCDTDSDLLTSADCEIFKADSNGISQITDNEVMDAYIVSNINKIYWNQDGFVTDGKNIIECDRLKGGFDVIGSDNPIIVYTSYDTEGIEYYNACYNDGESWGKSIELNDTQNLIGGYTAISVDDKLNIISNEIVRENNTANLCMQSFYNVSDITITDAYYDMHTLVAGNHLKVYADIQNNSQSSISEYTIYAYANNELLATYNFSNNLCSGDSIEKILYIPLPNEISFDKISLFAVKRGNSVDLNSSDFDLKLRSKDVSVENANIVKLTNVTDMVYASIVNRGISELTQLTISLRKDSFTGEIIGQKTIDSIGIKSEESISFNLGIPVNEGTVFYITVDSLENENILSNNSILVVKEYFDNNVIIEENNTSITFNGWVLESDKWAYYENGVKVTERWVKDSVGWCYLDENGYCATNCWKKDSVGWCYLDSNGRMVTNAWVKDSQGWCYIGADGYAVINCWKQDSVGWCYLDSNGSMVKSSWLNDGTGWYYLNGDGYMVSNCWMKDSNGWCYLGSSGKMATNQWIKDSVGWCYVGADGYCVTNCWMQDSIGWCYLDAEGRMVTNAWVNDTNGSCWLDANGYWNGVYA